MAEKRLTYDELVDEGVKAIIRSFGRGEDLRGAVSFIVRATALWVEEDNKKPKGGKK